MNVKKDTDEKSKKKLRIIVKTIIMKENRKSNIQRAKLLINKKDAFLTSLCIGQIEA